MDYNLLSIIKKEKEKLKEEKNDNYSRTCDVHVKVENLVENGFEDYSQNSLLSYNQQETFNYDNIKEEKQSCYICSENFINSYSLYKHNLIHLKVPLVQRKLFICDVCSNFYKTKKQLQHHITTAHEDKTLCNRTNSLKSMYKCEVCKKVLKYKTWLDHKQKCHKQTKVQCDKCNKLFKCTHSLKRHLKNFHSEETFQCKICKSVLKSRHYLLIHMREVHYDDGMLHHCDICGKSFKSPKKVRIHKKHSHDYQEGITFQCPKCPKIFNYKYTLKAHLKRCHSKGKFQCKICKSVYKSKHYLWTHMRWVHCNDGMLCDICGMSFKSPRGWKQHKCSTTCQEGVTVQCPICPKILNCKSSLRAHLKNCHSEGPFQCRICKSVFKSKPYLATHMWRAHDDDGILHHCDICGKSFKSPSRVKRHKKYCHTYQERITVQCPKCPKIFSKSYLKAHLRICHSEGTFQCKICNSVFKSEVYLRGHMWKVHDDDGKVHHCDICGKSFKSPRRVRLHKKSHSM